VWQVLGVEQLDGDVDEIGPLLGKVDMEDLLQRNDQLRADIRLGGVGEDGDQACANRGLFVVGDGRGGGGDAVGFGPALVDAVLEVDGRWEWECQWVSLKSREGNGDDTLDSRNPVSCSASRMFSRASRKPGVSSAYTQNTTSQSNFLTSNQFHPHCPAASSLSSLPL
jgi:hypothetical protein